MAVVWDHVCDVLTSLCLEHIYTCKLLEQTPGFFGPCMVPVKANEAELGTALCQEFEVAGSFALPLEVIYAAVIFSQLLSASRRPRESKHGSKDALLYHGLTFRPYHQPICRICLEEWLGGI